MSPSWCSSQKKLILAVVMSMLVVVTAVSSSMAPIASRARELEDEAASSGWFRTTVAIHNNLTSKQNLQVHCKDKHGDFGVHKVRFNTEYSFSFNPNLFGSDYFCGFVFNNALHSFDIYLGVRDFGQCTGMTCNWFINEYGPCFVDSRNPNWCYSWNRD